jgi:alpha-L-rhamnosidase
MLYLSAHGVVEGWLNGERIGEDIFVPGWSDYRTRLYYFAYDVTAMVEPNALNVLAAKVGPGWYGSQTQGAECQGGSAQRLGLLAELRLEYEDGVVQRVCSDAGWRCAFSELLEAHIDEGEHCDARLEPGEWLVAPYDDAGWCGVVLPSPAAQGGVGNHLPCMQGYPGDPVRRTARMRARGLWEAPAGSMVYDFGQSCRGRVRIRVKGVVGTVVRIRYSQRIGTDRSLDVDHPPAAGAIDCYVLKGEVVEFWEPSFCIHGFRYVEITGLGQGLQIADVVAIVLGADMSRVGYFSCSSDMVNGLYHALEWSLRSNFLEVPLYRCGGEQWPGWYAAIEAGMEAALYTLDAAAFFTKWFVDLFDAQFINGSLAPCAPRTAIHESLEAGWGDIVVSGPLHCYTFYGDRGLLERYFEPMVRWVDYLDATAIGALRLQGKSGLCQGDWMALDSQTSPDVIMTALFARTLAKAAQWAARVGREDERQRFEQRLLQVRTAFCDAFVNDAGEVQSATQTAYLLALGCELLPPQLVPLAGAHLIDSICSRQWHWSTGLVGTPLLLQVLTRLNRVDVAYKLLLNDSVPSWGAVERSGVTTIGESWGVPQGHVLPWGGYADVAAHYALGAVGSWLFSTIGGLQPLEPGFKRARIAPRPQEGLSHAKVLFRSINGLYEVRWIVAGGRFRLQVEVPPNTRARVVLPPQALEEVTIDGKAPECLTAVRCCPPQDGGGYEIGSGSYDFEALYTP